MNSTIININRITLIVIKLIILLSCNSNDINPEDLIIQDNGENNNGNSDGNNIPKVIKILSLGDSYTVGTGVCSTCSFPIQLKNKLQEAVNKDFKLDIIAQAGWTTTALYSAIINQDPSSDYDLVTLLIGVNNQNQQKPLDLYILEFPTILNKAIQLAKGYSKNVVVISIPDYVYTPYGQDLIESDRISNEIDIYNAFAKQTAENKNVKFLNITDITRNGLVDPTLVSLDGLHPSKKAYDEFNSRLSPICLEILK